MSDFNTFLCAMIVGSLNLLVALGVWKLGELLHFAYLHWQGWVCG